MTPKETIEVVASRWAKKFPRGSIVERQDLLSEGWLIHLKLECSFEQRGKVSYTTYLWYELTYAFNKMLKKEYSAIVGTPIKGEPVSYNTPDRTAALHQALEALSSVSAGFVDMIMNGVTAELLLALKHKKRRLCCERGWKAKNSVISPDRQVIEDFFNVDIKMLSKVFYNYV